MNPLREGRVRDFHERAPVAGWLLAAVACIALVSCGSGPEAAATIESPSGANADITVEQLDSMVEVVQGDLVFMAFLYPEDDHPRRVRANVLTRLIREASANLALDEFEVELTDAQRIEFEASIRRQLERLLLGTDSLDPQADAQRMVESLRPFIDMTIVAGAAADVLAARNIDLDASLASSTVTVQPEIGMWRADILRVTTAIEEDSTP